MRDGHQGSSWHTSTTSPRDPDPTPYTADGHEPPHRRPNHGGTSELINTLRAINRHLDSRDQDTILSVARKTLTDYGVTEPLRITFGVDEWDNGYFYADIEKVENTQGVGVDLPRMTLDALHVALEGLMTQLSTNGPPLGRFSRITIDLANKALSS